MKRVLVTGLTKSLLLLVTLLLSATNLLAQGNSGLVSSEPGEIGFNSGNNDLGFSSSKATPIASGLIVNWVDKGAVTKVKNQGACDSSWAFSATGALEGWAKIEKGHLPSLSEQELVDCDTLGTADGCNGGDPESGLMYAMQGGLCLESAYSYRGRVGKCKKCNAPHDKPARIYQVPKNNESMLQAMVDRQPVAVMIDGSWMSSYRRGVLTGPCGKQLDTAALVVGYGTDGATDYWLLKSSLGEDWGEKGYFRLVRGNNQCGIAEFAVVPASQ